MTRYAQAIRRSLLFVGLAAAGSAPVTAQGSAKSQAIYLVRHAEKANDGTSDPHLTAVGESRARALEAALRDSNVTTVIVTQLQRTRETAAPFLTAHPATLITLTISGSLQGYADSVKAIIGRSSGAVLVVGHSNTIPVLIAALGGPKGVVVCDGQFADLFIVRRGGSDSTTTLVRSHYGAADPPGAQRCP